MKENEKEKKPQNGDSDTQNEEDGTKKPQNEASTGEVESLTKKVEHLEAQRLAQQKKELEEVENRIDKKMKDFKKFVADTEVQGKSLLTEEKTEEDKAIDAAEKLLEGSGLSIKETPEPKFVRSR